MKQLFSPSGEINFRGDLEQLLHAIIRVDGVLMENQQFRCVVMFPKITPGITIGVTSRGRISFVFRCQYEQNDSGFRIRYRVWPSLLGMFMLFIPFFAVYAGYIQFAEQGTGWYGLLMGASFALVFYPPFFWTRKRCIRHFCEAFHEF